MAGGAVRAARPPLAEFDGLLSAGSCLFVGDLNHNIRLDGTRSRERFRDIVERLTSAGLVSAWHPVTGEVHQAVPHRLCLRPARLSDHVPVTVDLGVQRA